jgi:hypothetical protein
MLALKAIKVRSASARRLDVGEGVSLPAFGRTVQSDELGHFRLQVEASYQATVELMARKPGYRTHEQYATLGNSSLGFTLQKAEP